MSTFIYHAECATCGWEMTGDQKVDREAEKHTAANRHAVTTTIRLDKT